MAYKQVLTPILGLDADVPKDETTPEFMNMKFGELLGNTEDNRQQISILNGNGLIGSALKYLANPSTNLNDFVQTGLHKIPSSAINAPPFQGLPHPLSTEGELKVFSYNSTYITHKFESLYGGTAERVMSAGAWQPWRMVATIDKIDISFVNGWSNAYSGFGNRPLSIDIIGSKILIEGIITNPSVLTANTTIAMLSKTLALKKIFYAVACNSAGTKFGESTFIIEGNTLNILAPNISSLGDGFFVFD